MAKLFTILSNVWNEPQSMVYHMIFQQSGSDKNRPCSSKTVEKKITDTAGIYQIPPSNESTKALCTKSVQAGSGLKKYRNTNNQCGVPYKKLQNKSVNFICDYYTNDCKVGPSLVNLINVQTNSTKYKICEAHREVFQILTDWPRRAESSRVRKKNSTSYYGCVKSCLSSIGKALIMEKIKVPTCYPPEQQIMKLYKCLSLNSFPPKKAKTTLGKENGKRSKGTRPIKTKTKCIYTQTDEGVCHEIQ